MKVIALDYGAARTGVAVSDATGTIVRPLGVVSRAASDDGLEELGEIVREQEAERVVVGMPLTLRGERGQQAEETDAFVEALRAVGRRAGGDVRRAVHNGPGRAARRRSRRGRAGGGPPPRELPRARGSAMKHALALVAVAVLAVVAAGCMRDEAPPAVETTPPLARLRIIFPEGFTRRDMADRVAAVREIAIEKRGVTPRLTRTGYLQASGAAVPPPEFRKDWKLSSIEGFLFPATYEFTKLTSSRAPRLGPAAGVPAELAQGRPALCALEESDAVRRPDHRVDDREGGGRARASGSSSRR